MSGDGDPRSFHELREYRLRADGAPDYLRNFAGHIVPRLLECGFVIQGSWIAEPDEPGVTTFVWLTGWRDRAERDAAFARLVAWEGWLAYRQSVASVVIEVRSRFLLPVAFGGTSGVALLHEHARE